VHRPLGGKRVAAGGAEMTEDGVVSRKINEHPLHAVAGEGIMPVGNEDVTAKTGFKRANCVL